MKRNGSVEDSSQAWVWSDFDACVTCAGEIPDAGEFRRYCSRSCAVMVGRGVRPAERECAQCGGKIDMTARSPGGKRKYSSASCCSKCRAPHLTRHVPALVARDGIACGICGCDVDLTLAYPEPLSKSVDHVIPRSLGGPDELTNYRLSHLRCNVRRKARMDDADMAVLVT
ncbi:HNH endonuclease [Pseudoclavibacter helvolus]|uniref:HNH endonuclease n=1 Tax=Pseudoclavibacter helvolus TaxID=255205 RepID=UPI003C713BAB